MAAHCKYLSEEAVEGDPSVDVDDRAKKDAHKLVVVWNKYEVLIRHCDARSQIHNQDDPGANLRMAQGREGTHKNSVAKKQKLESGL